MYIYTYVNMYIFWDTNARWCMCTHTSQVCMAERAGVCACVCACVCVNMYTRTPTQADLYDLYVQLLACLCRYVCVLAYVCFVVTLVFFVCSGAGWLPAPALGSCKQS